jgi:hypothetical protein
MHDMKANWRSTNSPNVVFINTDLHRATLLDEDVSYPIEDLRQGRDCKTPVPAFSILAGEPQRTREDDDFRAVFWQSYIAVVALTLVSVVILACWPN